MTDEGEGTGGDGGRKDEWPTEYAEDMEKPEEGGREGATGGGGRFYFSDPIFLTEKEDGGRG